MGYVFSTPAGLVALYAITIEAAIALILALVLAVTPVAALSQPVARPDAQSDTPPAASTRRISPPLTRSKPAPRFAKWRRIARDELAFIA